MPGRGRPPGPSGDTLEAVLRAAFELLVTEGPEALTPTRLHQETGVARTTIYRHWPTPAALVEVILARATERVDLDRLTGDLAHDLEVALSTITDRFAHRPVRALYRAMRSHGTDEEPLARRYLEGLVAPVRDVISAAVDAGDLVGDVDDLTAELCGPLFFRYLLMGDELAADAAASAVAAFLP